MEENILFLSELVKTMLKRNKKGNILIQCVVGMAILFCFILMTSTYNLMQIKFLRRDVELEKISDYLMNFKREIRMEETVLNGAKLGDVFYLMENELKCIHMKKIKNIIKKERREDSIFKILIAEENEFTNKIRIIYLGEKAEVEEEAYVWKAKKRTDDDRSHLLGCIYRNNKHINM